MRGALVRNLVISAGAGSGKTHALVEVVLAAYAGAGGSTAAPGEVFVLTFTEKAAHELRERIETAVRNLARGEGTLGGLESPAPPSSHWQLVLEQLPEAPIGTFHGVCARLLRTHAASEGAFAILDEEESRSLSTRIANDLVSDRLDDPAVLELSTELGGAGALVHHLLFCHRALAEEGLATESLARQPFDVAVLDLRAAAVAAALAELAGTRDQRLAAHAAIIADERASLAALDVAHVATWYPIVDRIVHAARPRGLSASAKSRFDSLAGAFEAFGRDFAGKREVELASTIVVLLRELDLRKQAEKERLGLLEFVDIVRRTTLLLRSDTELRTLVKSRIRAVLVDEFQDTNSVQLELLLLLAERRDRARTLPAGLPLDLDSLPIEDGVLCAVGDRKQSIYEFRGADVGVFQRLLRHAERAEGFEMRVLEHSHRSLPTIVEFHNRVFAQVFSPTAEARDFEVAWRSGDALVAVRPEAESKGPSVVLLDEAPPPGLDAVRRRRFEAGMVAAHVRGLVDAGVPACDVAVLLRTHAQVPVYRRALRVADLETVLVGGRGFFAAPEVRDLLALLLLVADPDDVFAATVTLRAPTHGVSNEAFVRLSAAGSATPAKLTTSGFPTWLEANDRAALLRLVTLTTELGALVDRSDPAMILALALERLEIREALAFGPEPEQRLANVDKLLRIISGHERPLLADLARGLLARGEDLLDREAPAEVTRDADRDAVRLMTIHAAKGLEFPVVVVPELGSEPPRALGRVMVDRELGLGMSLRDPVGRFVRGERSELVRARARARREAEGRRLLYVALTRARDRLVLAGQAGARPTSANWRVALDQALASDAGGLVRMTEVPRASARLAAPRPETTVDQVALDRAHARCRVSTLDADRELAASVTALADLARCPRRYYLRVLVGLDEHAAYDRTGPDDDEPRTDDHRQRGNLAHRLLESVDLASLGRDPAGALREAAEVEGIDLSTDPELAADLRAFLATEHMKTVAAIAAADSRRVHRELAFVLRLAPDEGRTVVNLSGQIDLLWIDDSGAAVIVDYKLARSPRGEELAETYRQQLDGYALAVRRLFGPEVPIRAGLAWLRDRGAEPQLVTVDQAALDAHERGLMGQVEQLGRLLGEHDRVHPWPRLADRSLCGSCGFVSRCWSPVAS